ncbi:flavin reductase family protein [Paenarthrobacter aurescens]|uniref:Putative oxidoreductase n=1 Tax=Paenarthrobacter aurescens TaxID=43663 RepID=A0A4Y3N8P2_PAEAU|nr:flavin reductase family protein [Paenarthrobacter aurescens]MDO6143381.1 flavin reductase family protein [Paenarthrobacter aurescens]MDO6147229.1 flavin reductase family protein [Paenarthrobacter aurescens]MDO6158473.1 flavin reductase family protein [Paenarthrobacter aurescens]MDO6162457.1 flavin reductase family protein [Paenarthrobacter aurescens]GEB18200.1 putative oxidoreductase [Paenarthrobacter aurescens]
MHKNSLASGHVTAAEMRHVLAGFPTGLVLVAAEVEGNVVGLSANSFTTVSLDPPLVSISFAHSSTSWPILRRATRWGVSVLGEQQAHVLQELRRPAHERFNRLDMQVQSGAAFAAGALAKLTVELDTEIEAGDHTLTLLRVFELHRDTEQHPLIFFGSGTHRLAR